LANVTAHERSERSTSSETVLWSSASPSPSTLLSMSSHVVLVAESASFRVCVFYAKCALAPFVAAALVFFCVRLYLNDLYIAIPDRMLIAAAMAQLVRDVPPAEVGSSKHV
jgi:hypothetical protein